MTQYNFCLDFAASIILLIVSISYFHNKHFHDVKFLAFVGLICSCFGIALNDVLACCFYAIHYQTAFLIFNTLYFLMIQVTIMHYVRYVFYQLHLKSTIRLSHKLILYGPSSFAIFLIILNPIFHWLFFMDENGNYSKGPLQIICYLVVVFYFAYSIGYVMQHRHFFTKYQEFSINFMAVIAILTFLFNLFDSSLQIIAFVFASGVLFLHLSSAEESVIDKNTGMLNKEYFANLSSKLIYSKSHFDVVLVRIADYDLITSTYGLSLTEKFMDQVAVSLMKYAKIGEGFKISNDTFAILINKDNDSSFSTLPDRIRSRHDLPSVFYEQLNTPFEIDHVNIAFSFFITELSYPKLIKDEDTLNAYLAYFQKTKKMRYGILASDELQIHDKLRENEVEQAIRRSLDEHNFVLFYQPIKHTGPNGSFVSAEALIRMFDTKLGFVSPAEFIPIAEKCGLIIDVGNFVVEEVCSFIERNDLNLLGISYIELNLSVIQCLQRDFFPVIEQIIRKHKVNTDQLCFEITETASNCAPEIFTNNLNLLKEKGYALALDDFGTGYANLQRLINTNFDFIKFDKEMSQAACQDPYFHQSFEKLVSIFHSIGAQVVAEGIETKEQLEFMEECKVDYIQGFYYSKPLPEQDYIAFLKSKN